MIRGLLFLRLFQIGFDFILILLGFILAYFIRVDWIFSSDLLFRPFFIASLFSSALWSIFLLFTKFYKIFPENSKTQYFLQWQKIAGGGVLAIGFLIVYYFFKDALVFSRLLNVYGFIFGSLLLALSQFLFLWILTKIKKNHPQYQVPTLIVGANRIAETLIEQIQKNPFTPYAVIGVIDPYGLAPENFRGKILGKLNKLETLCEEKKIKSIIQCDSFEHTINILSLCQERQMKFQLTPSLRGVAEESLRIRKIGSSTVISFVNRESVGIEKKMFWLFDWFLENIFDVD